MPCAVSPPSQSQKCSPKHSDGYIPTMRRLAGHWLVKCLQRAKTLVKCLQRAKTLQLKCLAGKSSMLAVSSQSGCFRWFCYWVADPIDCDHGPAGLVECLHIHQIGVLDALVPAFPGRWSCAGLCSWLHQGACILGPSRQRCVTTRT